MPYQPRYALPSMPQHVLQRGNKRPSILEQNRR
jgi:hypothetical protein